MQGRGTEIIKKGLKTVFGALFLFLTGLSLTLVFSFSFSSIAEN